jgi:LuxR family maltose regulon positive regulatory protein
MAAVELSFDLIEAKLAPPALRTDTVVKKELIDRLCAAESRAVSVVAPAGYGKTTLLSQWAERDPRFFATVSLDERDNDVVVLLRYIVAALDRSERISASVFEALWGPGRSIWSTCIPRVGAALSALTNPVVLVLDDLHFLSDQTCLDAVATLLEHIPEGSLMVLATREDPDLPLARLRAQGRVLEIAPDDLRLTEDEAAMLLRSAGVDLDPSDVAELTRRTEGWPAGLYLAALSLQAGVSGAGGAQTFSGDDRLIADYLRLELLSGLTADEVRFLTRTSVLDRMCGDLCDAVLERSDSASVLASLERSNRFLVPLDPSRDWYRYHHLFRDLLRSELKRREPELAPELNRRAMEWCDANDFAEAAVVYGHAAGETAAVASMVETLCLPLYYDGRLETLDEWLGWFADEDLVQFPAIAVFGAWVRVHKARPAEAERCLSLAEGATSTIPLSDGSATIEPWVANLRAYMMPDGAERALADADLALEQFAPESGWRPSALLIRGVSHALLGATDQARADLAAAVETGTALGAVDDVFVAQAELALLAAQQGVWKEAGQRARQAQALVAETGLDDYPASAVPNVAAARVALHEGRQADARSALARAHRLRPLLDRGFPWLTVQVGLELTRAHLALGEAGAAETVLSEAEGVLRVRPRLGTLVADAQALRERVAATSTPSGERALSLTSAELRLLPMLTTHLSFPEIGARLFVERTTVKTQAISIYRKFGVSSRGDAIERAVELGLLEDSPYLARANPSPSG